MNESAPLWWFVGIAGFLAVVFIAFIFTSEGRLRRRRRKSQGRVVTSARRPMVQLSVDPPKDQGKR